jgi:hypothetical protein
MGWLRRGVVLGACAVVATVGMACGEDAEPSGPYVTLLVTRDFGRETISEERLPLAGHTTAMRLLEESHDVDADQGFVKAVDGLRSNPNPPDDDEETLWAVYVNGLESDVPTADFPLVAGDVVQLDLRDYYVTLDVRATVGAFPQPFTGGMLGGRFPVRIRCAQGYHVACAEVRQKLRKAGVDPTGAPPAQPRLTPALRKWRGLVAPVRRATVLVGPWYRWRNDKWARRLEQGARYSGVFVRPGRDTLSMRLLDWDAHHSETLTGEVGLVAAMRPTEEDLLWFVTGINLPGVEKAAHALTPRALRGAYAVIATDDGLERIPVPPSSGRRP